MAHGCGGGGGGGAARCMALSEGTGPALRDVRGTGEVRGACGEAHSEHGDGEHEVDGEQRGAARERRLGGAVPRRAHVEVLEYALLPALHEGRHLVVLVRGAVEADILEVVEAIRGTVLVLHIIGKRGRRERAST
eukprot:scaffold46026_cov47-Phaeocystis_antarctica.AAC.3